MNFTRIIILVLLVLSTVTGRAAEFFVRNGDRVVFLGDSITEQRLYTTYIEAYALTRYPQWKLSFRNVSWSGDTAWLRQRAHPDEGKLFAAKGAELDTMVEKAVGTGLARDVLPLKPTVVTIKFGMNDHAYQPFRADIFAAYVRSQQELVKVLQKNGARVALLTPQPIEDKKADLDQDVRNISLRKFSDGLKEVAREKRALFVDQFAPYMALMLPAHKANPTGMIGGGDAVHPGPAGQTLMAWAVLKGLGATPLVSEAELDARTARVKAVRCRISKLHVATDGISFDRADDSLPMPIDARAEPALKLAPVADELSRCTLKITGLTANRYQVTIDTQTAGFITKEDLAKGWNLTTAAGPIDAQTKQVLQLIVKKNDVFFNRWRNVQLNAKLDAAAKQAELAKLDQQIADLETQINTARQPKPHHFELKPVVE